MRFLIIRLRQHVQRRSDIGGQGEEHEPGAEPDVTDPQLVPAQQRVPSLCPPHHANTCPYDPINQAFVHPIVPIYCHISVYMR